MKEYKIDLLMCESHAQGVTIGRLDYFQTIFV